LAGKGNAAGTAVSGENPRGEGIIRGNSSIRAALGPGWAEPRALRGAGFGAPIGTQRADPYAGRQPLLQ
jgi:hypothetical protein